MRGQVGLDDPWGVGSAQADISPRPASAWRSQRRGRAMALPAASSSSRRVRVLVALVCAVCFALAACAGGQAARVPPKAVLTPASTVQPTPTPTYAQAALAVAQSSGASGNVSVTTAGTDITVRDVISAQPDLTSARNAVFAEAFALQRAIWESLLRPSSVTIIVSAPAVANAPQSGPLGTCTLTASKDATVLWSAETPLDAWGYVYDSATLARALTP